MRTQEKLISAMRARFAGESEAAIARHAGLTPQRWNNYTQANRRMDDDAILGCAKALGLEPLKTLAAHHSELARTPRERAFWQGWAAAIAAAALIPFVLAISTTTSHAGTVEFSQKSRTVNIMSCWMRRALAQLARILLSGNSPDKEPSRWIIRPAALMAE